MTGWLVGCEIALNIYGYGERDGLNPGIGVMRDFEKDKAQGQPGKLIERYQRAQLQDFSGSF